MGSVGKFGTFLADVGEFQWSGNEKISLTFRTENESVVSDPSDMKFNLVFTILLIVQFLWISAEAVSFLLFYLIDN